MKDGIYITQSKYIKEILKKFGMEDSRPARTSMSTRHKLSKNDDSKEVDQTTYRSMIRKLQYVVHTRPNIALIVGMVARFSKNLKENYMMTTKRIMRYLNDTEDYGLYYKKGGNLDMKEFTGANWLGSADDRKNTSGGVFFLGRRFISWLIKKKYCIS